MSAALALRPAVQNDAGFLVWALQEASGGLFGRLFGLRAESILAVVVAQSGHSLSFEHAVVAESNGIPRGLCHGMPYGTPSSTQALMHAAGIRSLRASAIMAAGGPLFAALDRHSPGEWYLQAIAVESAARGSGVGRSLLDDAFVRAARAGCASLTLDVDATNVRARALYERQGLHVAGTSPPAVLLGGARVHRMAVALPGPL